VRLQLWNSLGKDFKSNDWCLYPHFGLKTSKCSELGLLTRIEPNIKILDNEGDLFKDSIGFDEVSMTLTTLEDSDLSPYAYP